MKKIQLIILLIFFGMLLNAQTADSTKDKFYDDLLDHLTGKWHDTAIAHGEKFTSEVDVSWVLNHQFLLIHLKSNEIIPWWGVPMEYYQYVGYNRRDKRYTVHGMSIEGDADLSEGFCYGYRNGNEFKTVAKFGKDTSIVQRMTWQPQSKSWIIQSSPLIKGKEGKVFLDMRLTRAE